MPECVPVSELKDTVSFVRRVKEADGPVVVTKNGVEEIVALSPSAFEALKLEGMRARLYEKIDRAERSFAKGDVVDARAGMAELKARYGV